MIKLVVDNDAPEPEIERLSGHVAFAVCGIVGFLVALPIGIWLF